MHPPSPTRSGTASSPADKQSPSKRSRHTSPLPAVTSPGQAPDEIPACLSFEPTQYPTWRPATLPDTNSMLLDIIRTVSDGSLAKVANQPLEDLTIIYTAETNRLELGWDTATTEAVLLNNVCNPPQQLLYETRNTLEALQYLTDSQPEMVASTATGGSAPSTSSDQAACIANKLLLSTDIISGAHKVLMRNVNMDAGQLRTSGRAYTATDTGRFWHLEPQQVPSALQCLVDQHNHIVMQLFSNPNEDMIPLLFKLVSQLLLRFLAIQPFTDGNGRLARLLANLLLDSVLPFPVVIHPPYVTNQQYTSTIQSAMFAVAGTTSFSYPCDLAAMIIEGVWFSISDAETLCTHTISYCRGEVFASAPTVSEERYLLLHRSAELSSEEQQEEVRRLQEAAAQLFASGTAETIVHLLHGTTCILRGPG